MTRRQGMAMLRLGVSAGLLAVLWHLLDGAAVMAKLAALEPAWILLALGLSVPQQLISAWRWRLTAGRLGASLGYRHAVADYYLASFLNQVLPGGVGGDVLRAWRHGRRLQAREGPGMGPAFRAVIYERAAGQVVLLLFFAVGFLVWPWQGRAGLTSPAAAIWAFAFAALGLLALWLARRPGRRASRLLSEVHRAVFARDVVLYQLALSAVIVLTYLATFTCAAGALGLWLAPAVVFTLVPVVLLAMTLPISIAGWGLREGAAAALWVATGMPAADGVAISLTYGLIVLLASLPGAAVLVVSR